MGMDTGTVVGNMRALAYTRARTQNALTHTPHMIPKIVFI